jgi:hypothetical protein
MISESWRHYAHEHYSEFKQELVRMSMETSDMKVNRPLAISSLLDRLPSPATSFDSCDSLAALRIVPISRCRCPTRGIFRRRRGFIVGDVWGRRSLGGRGLWRGDDFSVQ